MAQKNPPQQRSAVRLALVNLAQKLGVERDDLITALGSELQRYWGIRKDMDPEIARQIVRRQLWSCIENLTIPRAILPVKFKHAVLVGFNLLRDKEHASLKNMDLTRRQIWLEEHPLEKYRVSKSTSWRYTNNAISQIEQQILASDYRPVDINTDAEQALDPLANLLRETPSDSPAAPSSSSIPASVESSDYQAEYPANKQDRPLRVRQVLFSLSVSMSVLLLHLTVVFAPLVFDIQTWSVTRSPVVIAAVVGTTFVLTFLLSIWRRIWTITVLFVVASLLFGLVTWNAYDSLVTKAHAATPNVNSKNLSTIWPLGWDNLRQSDGPCPNASYSPPPPAQVVPLKSCEARDGTVRMTLASSDINKFAEYPLVAGGYTGYSASQQHSKKYYAETRVHADSGTSLGACGIELGTNNIRSIFAVSLLGSPVKPSLFQDPVLYQVVYKQVTGDVPGGPSGDDSGWPIQPSFVGKSSVAGWSDDYWTKLAVYRDGDNLTFLVNDRVVASSAQANDSSPRAVPTEIGQGSTNVPEFVDAIVRGGLGSNNTSSCEFDYFSFVNFSR